MGLAPLLALVLTHGWLSPAMTAVMYAHQQLVAVGTSVPNLNRSAASTAAAAVHGFSVHRHPGGHGQHSARDIVTDAAPFDPIARRDELSPNGHPRVDVVEPSCP